MKKLFFIPILIFSIIHCIAQDKTLKWGAPEIQAKWITITKSSPSFQGYNYYQELIIPKSDKLMRLEVSSRHSYWLQVKNKKKELVNTSSYSEVYLLPTSKSDSTALYILCSLKDYPTQDVYIKYYFDDTTQLKIPSGDMAAFEFLLEHTTRNFIRLYPGKTPEAKDLNFSNGIFAKLPAHVDRSGVDQKVGSLSTLPTANKTMAEWNKKITAWLKPYAVKDVKSYNKEELRKRSNMMDDLTTEYVKKDAQGKVLFMVTVYLQAYEDQGYFTGVRIAQR